MKIKANGATVELKITVAGKKARACKLEFFTPFINKKNFKYYSKVFKGIDFYGLLNSELRKIFYKIAVRNINDTESFKAEIENLTLS